MPDIRRVINAYLSVLEFNLLISVVKNINNNIELVK
jgi:hypothetical protein